MSENVVVKQMSTRTANWDHVSMVAGRVEAKAVETIEGKERQVMTVATESGKFRVFESYCLDEAFAAASVGDGVVFEHLGKVGIKGGKSLRDFRTVVFEWPMDNRIPEKLLRPTGARQAVVPPPANPV